MARAACLCFPRLCALVETTGWGQSPNVFSLFFSVLHKKGARTSLSVSPFWSVRSSNIAIAQARYFLAFCAIFMRHHAIRRHTIRSVPISFWLPQGKAEKNLKIKTKGRRATIVFCFPNRKDYYWTVAKKQVPLCAVCTDRSP
nr:hypothetical protein [Pandoravirus aubagnensis]